TSTLRVTATGPDAVRVSVRRGQFLVGRPIEFDEATPRVAALEYALGALASEVVSGLREFAWRHRVDIDAIEALVTGEVVHQLASLEVVGENGPPVISHIRLTVFVSSPDVGAVRRLWHQVLDRLPLLGTMRAAVPIDLELTLTA